MSCPPSRPANTQHRLWAWETLQRLYPSLAGRKIALLGLTYKPRTNTLRRSSALELAGRLADAKAEVVAWDPMVRELPETWRTRLQLAGSSLAAVENADALVVCTPWPEFRELDWPGLLGAMRHPRVLDAGRFLQRQLENQPKIGYFAVGISPHA